MFDLNLDAHSRQLVISISKGPYREAILSGGCKPSVTYYLWKLNISSHTRLRKINKHDNDKSVTTTNTIPKHQYFYYY